MRKQFGFTLIEILVVMGILLFVSTIIGGVFFSSLRNANKASAVSVIQDNGNYAMSQMVKTIQFAKSFDSLTDGTGTHTSCVPPTSSGPYTAVTITTFKNVQITYTCDTADGAISETDNPGSARFLTNPTSAPLDTTASPVCSFSCSQTSTFTPPIITINFGLAYKSANGSTLNENTARVSFKTSVSPRNYSN